MGVKSEGMEEQMGQENEWEEGKEVSDHKRKWKQRKREAVEMKMNKGKKRQNGYTEKNTHNRLDSDEIR